MGRLLVGVLAGGDEFAPNWPYPDPGGVAIYRHQRADFAKLLIDRVIHCRRNATDPSQIGPISTPGASPITDTIEPILPSC